MNKKHNSAGHDLSATIIIDGESAEELAAIGTYEIVQYLKKCLKVKQKDIKRINLSEKYVEKGVITTEIYGKYERDRKENMEKEVKI